MPPVVPRGIQVYENHAGPIPTPQDGRPDGQDGGGLHYEFVAYADAEDDTNLYGYGHTVHAAIADFCRNHAEAYCSGCTDCEDSLNCLLTSGELSNITKRRIREYENNLSFELEDFYRHSASHEDWTALNNPNPWGI